MQTRENRPQLLLHHHLSLLNFAHELQVIGRALVSRVACATAEFKFSLRNHVYIILRRRSVTVGRVLCTLHKCGGKLKSKIFAHDIYKSILTRRFIVEVIRHLTRKFVDKSVILLRSNVVSTVVHELAEYGVEEDDWNGYQPRRAIAQDARINQILVLFLMLGGIGRSKALVLVEVFFPQKLCG
jgi:hypothetical protein